VTFPSTQDRASRISGRAMLRFAILSVPAVFAAALWSASPALAAPCTKFGPVVVTGTVERTFVYGAPNFGEDPAHDERDHVPFLRLDKPLAVCAAAADGGDPASPRQVARHMHMIFLPPLDSRDWYRRHVTVTGEILPWETIWHRTPVMLNVGHIRATARP
jgi:hypothetical protein